MFLETQHTHEYLRSLGERWLVRRMNVLGELFAHHVACGDSHKTHALVTGMRVLKCSLALADARAIAAINDTK